MADLTVAQNKEINSNSGSSPELRHEHEHLSNPKKKNKEGELTRYIQKLDFDLLKKRLIKEAQASSDDFERFFPFFEFNLKFYRLELEDLINNSDFNDEKFNQFVNQKFREAVFEFKRFIKEDQEFRSYLTEEQYQSLFNSVYKINPAEHIPNQPMAAGEPCQNMDFNNNTANWVGRYCRGLNNSGTANDNRCWNGFGNGQYTKMTGGNDGIIPAIPRVPPGNTSSLRLGDTGPNNDRATIWQTFRVSQNNYIFVYKWAAVLDNAGGHPAATSPYFKVRMYRNFGQPGQQEISCATVDANSQTATQWGFSSSGGYRYKNWTTMFIPLNNYIGEDITIWFETSDCIVSGGTHEGYAYIWASCLPPNFTMSQPNLCAGGNVTITAPAGASVYSWYSDPPGGISGPSNGQSITATQGNTTYYVNMTTNTQPPYTPCSVTLDTLVPGSAPGLSPNFNPAVTCAGGPTFFTDLSTPPNLINSWAWDFNNDGITDATTQNPSYTFPTAGSYPVRLTVSNGSGCPKDTTINVQVLANPTANFNANNVCFGNQVLFQNNSSPPGGGNLTGSDWDFGDNLSSSQTSPNHLYAAPGTYQVTLTVTADNGCSNQITQPVTVNPLPNVGAGLQRDICIGDNTTLTGTGANIYSWSNGVSNNVSFSPTVTTVYTVWGTDANGCVNTDTVTVRVNPNPVADFSVDNVCFGFTSVFNQNSSLSQGSITSYSWNFGDGNTSTTSATTHAYAAPGNYNVYLSITSAKGCTSNITKPTTVYALPNIIGNSPKHAICLNDNTNLNASGGVTYSWTPSTGLNTTTGSTVLATPTNTIVYTLTGIDVNGCVNTDTVNVIVNPLPVADFSGTNACLNQQTNQFTDLSTVSSGNVTNWNWTFTGQPAQNIQNPSVNFTSSGTKSVTLIVTTDRGCKDTVTKNVQVYALPNADFNFTNVCRGFTTTLTNTSTNGTGTLNQFNWDFGDGNTANGPNTTNIYAAHGTYDVSLYVSDNFGCKDTVTKAVVVHPLPVANFSANSVCALKPTNLVSTSAVPSGSIVTWNWDLNNDQIVDATTSATTYTYTAGGTYQVYLQVTTNNGCRDSITKSVNVNHIPVADFSVNNKCIYETLQFNNSSTIASGSISGYDWIFGDGSISSAVNPQYQYATCGVKATTLVATSDSGCVHAITKQLTVYCEPQAVIQTQNACAKTPVSFSGASSSVNDGTINNYNWSLGNSINANGVTVSNTYPNAGDYTIRLIVTSSNGCVDTTNTTLTIYPLPVANFTNIDSCFGVTSCFNNTSTISTGSITSYCWDFDNSINTCEATTANACRLFPAPGNYPVKLIVQSEFGCRDTISKIQNIYPLPSVAFSTQDVCLGKTVSFTNNTSISAGIVNNYLWNFGDGNTAALTNPQNNYANSGTYTIQLIATSDKGCRDSLSKTVNVYPNPNSDFSASLLESCEPLCTDFANLSTVNNNPPSNIVSYQWWASNGWNVTANNPKNICFKAGTYDVRLIVTTDKGCSDTLIKSNYLVVHPNPVAGFSYFPSVTSVLDPQVSFLDESYGGQKIKWFFGDKDTTFQIQGDYIVHTYADTGTYVVTQIVTTQFGCIDSIKKIVVIQPDWVFYIPNAFTPNEDGINDFFNGKGYGIKEYELLIFDRWGNFIARVDDINSPGWDGTVYPHSEQCQIDTYVYKVRLTDIFDKKHYYTGTVHLVR